MLLIIPRLRLLILFGALIAVPGFFLASRHAEDAFDAVVPLWCAMVCGGALLLYIVLNREALWRRVRSRRDIPAVAPPRSIGVQPPIAQADARKSPG
jgi:hypothetical protein